MKVKKKRMPKKAQIWFIDFAVGLLIFIAALVFFFTADTNLLDREQNTLNDLNFESKLITESLMNTGYPRMWNKSNVVEIGISDNNRINETKLRYFGEIEYNTSKSVLKTKYDYYLFFQDSSSTAWINSSHEGTGKPGTNSTNVLDVNDPDYIVKMVRFVIYKSNPKKMVLYLWKQ